MSKQLCWLIKSSLMIVTVSLCLLNWFQGAAAATANNDLEQVHVIGRLPLEIDRATGQGLIIKASINGSEPLPFLLDTGLNQPVYIEEWAAELINLPIPAKADVVVSQELQLRSVSLKKLVLTGTSQELAVHYSDVPALAGNTFRDAGLGSPRLAGVIGLPLLKNFIIQIDCANKFLLVLNPKHPPQTALGSVCLKMTATDDSDTRYFVTWPSSERTTVTTSLDGKGVSHTVKSTTKDTCNLVIDTGSSRSSLPSKIINDLHPLAMFADKTFTVSGWQNDVSLFTPSLRLDTMIASNLYLTPSLPKGENILGSDVLRQFLVTLDFPGGQLILEKSLPLTEKGYIRGTTGIVLEQTRTGFFISRIRNNTEAERSGLQAGGKVLQIDGQSLRGLNENIAQRLLDGESGTDAHLVIQDKMGDSQNMALHRISQLEPTLYLDAGVQLGQNNPDKEVRITAILCSSAAWTAGVRAGDQVSRVNGVSIQSLSKANSLLQVWPRVKIALEVQRHGQKHIIEMKALFAHPIVPLKGSSYSLSERSRPRVAVCGPSIIN